LARALEEAGVGLAEIEVVPVDLSEHEALFRAGQLDAVTTYEPIASRLRALGAHTLYDSSRLRGEVFDVLLTHESVAEERAEDVEHLVSAWLQAERFLQQNPAQAAVIMGAREALAPQDFLDVLHSSAVMHDLEDNRRMLSGPEPALQDALRRVYQTSREFGLLQDDVELIELTTDRFLPTSLPPAP
jgi:NitT/TauT family transport system substrate-binding protein